MMYQSEKHQSVSDKAMTLIALLSSCTTIEQAQALAEELGRALHQLGEAKGDILSAGAEHLSSLERVESARADLVTTAKLGIGVGTRFRASAITALIGSGTRRSDPGLVRDLAGQLELIDEPSAQEVYSLLIKTERAFVKATEQHDAAGQLLDDAMKRWRINFGEVSGAIERARGYLEGHGIEVPRPPRPPRPLEVVLVEKKAENDRRLERLLKRRAKLATAQEEVEKMIQAAKTARNDNQTDSAQPVGTTGT